MILARIGESQGRILERLKRWGPGTIPDLAGALDLSVETVRTHLRSLGSEGLVERRGTRRSGPGRPEILYGLTAASEAFFPNTEGELLHELAGFLVERGDSGVVREFFEGRLEERRASAKQRLAGLEADERIDEVARILSEEGFMADVVTHGTDEKVLRLCHCPMRRLVDVTRVPCRSELEFVRRLLGRRLVRVSYIPHGDDACCYALRGKDDPGSLVPPDPASNPPGEP